MNKAPSCARNCPFLHHDSFSTIYLKGDGKVCVAKITLILLLPEINDFSFPYKQSIYTVHEKKSYNLDKTRIPAMGHNGAPVY